MPGPTWPRLYIITPMPGASKALPPPPPLFPFTPRFPQYPPLPPVLCIPPCANPNPPATFLVDAGGVPRALPSISHAGAAMTNVMPPLPPLVYVSGGCWHPFARSYATPGACGRDRRHDLDFVIVFAGVTHRQAGRQVVGGAGSSSHRLQERAGGEGGGGSQRWWWVGVWQSAMAGGGAGSSWQPGQV